MFTATTAVTAGATIVMAGVDMAYDSDIRAGESEVKVAGVTENTSQEPSCVSVMVGVEDELIDTIHQYHKEITAENVAKKYSHLQEKMDEFVDSPGLEERPARKVAVCASLPHEVTTMGVNMATSRDNRVGESEVMVAGVMENTSLEPS